MLAEDCQGVFRFGQATSRLSRPHGLVHEAHLGLERKRFADYSGYPCARHVHNVMNEGTGDGISLRLLALLWSQPRLCRLHRCRYCPPFFV